MSQRINLYRADLDIRRELPIWGRLAVAIMLSIVVGMAFWGAAQQELAQTEREMRTAKQQHDRTAQQLAELEALWNAPEVEQAKAAAERAEARAEALGHARQLLDSRIQAARGASLAEPLAILARAPHPGVWVTAVHVDGRAPALLLSGKAHSPDALPPYLEELTRRDFGLARLLPELEANSENGHIAFQYRFGEVSEQP